MPTKILFIALDSADYRFVERLERAGYLPEIAKIKRVSRVVPVSRGQGLTDDAIWASFQYAAELGDHARYHWQRDRAGRDDYYFNTQGEDGLQSWWEPLSDAGAKVAIFDIPKARLTAPTNGMHLTDWLAHGRYITGVKSFPADIANAVQTDFGAEPHSYCRDHAIGHTELDYDAVVDSLLQSADLKLKASLHYLDKDDWDLFAVGFKEIHCISHLAWDRDALEREDLSADHPVVRIFRRVDRAVGELVSHAGQECEVFLYSSTGIGGNQSIEHHLPELVERLNRQLFRPGLLSRLGLKAWRPVITQLPYNEDVVTLRVRPPAGMTMEEALDRIEQQLRTLRADGQEFPLFLKFDRPSSQSSGARKERLPDLMAFLNPNVMQPECIRSASLGVFENIPEIIRPGNHKGDGFMVIPDSNERLRQQKRMQIHEIGPLLSEEVKRAAGVFEDSCS